MAETLLIDSIAAAFEAAGWSFRRIEGHDVVESAFEAHHSKIVLHAQAFDAIGAASVVATASVNVPASHRPAAAELLMRTNEQLTVGNFELRWDGGEVLFRTTNIFPQSSSADPDILTGMVQNALAETDRITPYLATLIREPAGTVDVRSLLSRPDLAWEASP